MLIIYRIQMIMIFLYRKHAFLSTEDDRILNNKGDKTTFQYFQLDRSKTYIEWRNQFISWKNH